MSDVLPLLVVALALAAVMGIFRWLASRVRRRGTAGAAISAALASYDEAFRVTAHDAHHEIRAQAERKAPLLSPDRPWETGRGGPPPGERPRSRRLLRRRPVRLRRGRGRRAGGA
ncbi:hypothetical protein C5F59_017765 [Streptomyces sp. QL37]|uniref:hypothetical protein n=1 Tax=Streptomyces sp. QL37 TaxID=2093747 RepID=UPI0016527C4D|nr:hypothetical protein [Streptomyces sp. QL37]